MTACAEAVFPVDEVAHSAEHRGAALIGSARQCTSIRTVSGRWPGAEHGVARQAGVIAPELAAMDVLSLKRRMQTRGGMGQAKAAQDPSMDEILASIRKIIAEEPVGSRPVPAQQTKTVVTSGEVAARPFSGAGRQPVPPVGTPTETAPRGQESSDPMFGRLAEALGGRAPERPSSTPGGQSASMFADQANARAASQEPTERPAPGFTAEPTAVTAIADDLDDLLADDPIAPQAGEDRAFGRRNIDFGQVVPRDDKVEAAGQPAPKSGASAGAKPSTHAVAFEKMLSNRLATGKAEAAASEPEPEGPVVIASMADLGVDDGEASIELADAETSEDAKSAFGALMAGLEASAPVGETIELPEATASDAVPEAATAIGEKDAAGGVPDASEQVASTMVAGADVTPRVVAAQIELPKVTAAAVVVAVPADGGDTVKVAGGVTKPEAVTAAVVPTGGAAEAPALPAIAAMTGLAATLAPSAGGAIGVRTVEDIVAELLRPMLREWLAENMPRMVEKALRIELAEGLKTLDHKPAKSPREA